ncbi:MAG TPA: hypothetical protein VNH22_08125 [Blastocatellia bacterium]|jgi:hypothetical protein|nr:hypothetical protein [Blastocatellia bacterium]
MRWLKVVTLAATALMAASNSGGQDASPDYQRLLDVGVFAFGGVGFAGTISEGEAAFRKILVEDHAVETFARVLSQGGKREAQVYALCGLYVRDHKAFKQQASQLKSGLPKGQTIMVQTGCTIMPEDARDVIKRIESGDYDMFLGQPDSLKK